MKLVILSGGFAKRLWPLTKDTPKQLLKVGGRPMIQFVLEKIRPLVESESIDTVHISTNERFAQQFRDFVSGYDYPVPIEVIAEPTRSEDVKLGSIGALDWLIDELDVMGEELLLIGGDNIFSFDPAELLEKGRALRNPVVALFDVGSREKASLYGVLKIDEDENGRVIDFLEKPENPPSTLISTACYYFSPDAVADVRRYIEEGNNPDAMGFFIEWLYRNRAVYGLPFAGYWFDVGSLESLKEADEFFGG